MEEDAMTPIANLPAQLMNLLREHLSPEDIGIIADEYGERSGHKGSLYDQLMDRAGVQQVVRLLVLHAVARRDVMGLVRVVFEYRVNLQQVINASGFEQSSLIQTYLMMLQDEVDSFKKNVAELPNLRYMIKASGFSWTEVPLETLLSSHPRVILSGATRLERSAILLRLAEWLTADWRASISSLPFPVFADLGHWFNPEMSLVQFLQAQMSWAGVSQLIEQLPELIQAGRVVFLLDGMHELPYLRRNETMGLLGDPRVRSIVAWSQAKEGRKVKCVLSCQVRDFLINSHWSDLYALDPTSEEIPAQTDMLPQLISALSDEDTDVRRNAIIALGNLGDSRAIEPLIVMLKDETKLNERRLAAYALSRIEDERRIEPLLEALSDSAVRSDIASVMGDMHDERLIEPLVALLADNATHAYMSAKEALVAYGKAAVPALMVALTDLNVGKQYKKDDFPVLGRGDASYNAAEVLGEIGDIRPLPLLLWLIEHDSAVGESHMGGKVRHAAEKAVKKIQTRHQAAAPLVAALNSEDRTMSIGAAFALGLLKDHRAHRAVEPLLDALHDEDARVRWGAAKLLGRIGDPTPLIAALHDKDSYVRATAASILGTLGDRRAVEPLIAALTDENSRVRWQVICALGTLDDNRAVEPLIAALQNENDEVRLHVVQVLGSIGSRSAVEPLIAVLADQDSRIRQAAVEALGKLGDKRALPALLEAAKDSDREVRQSVGRAVFIIDPNSSVEVLIINLQDGDREVRYEATRNLIHIGDSRAVEPLIEALKDEYSRVREYAADALGKIGDSRAVEALIENLQDEQLVGWAAADALADIGDNRAIEPLIAVLKSEDTDRCSHAANALTKFSERAVPALLAALKDEGPGETFYSRDLREQGDYHWKFVDNLIKKAHLRYYTAEILGKVGDVRALPILMWMAAKDENETIYGINKVRDSAAQAIESIKQRYEDTDLLVAALNDQDHLARVGAAFALGMLKDERATEVLSTTLAEKDRRVRWSCAELLGNLGSERAIAALINALDDENANVRRSAVAALVKIGEVTIQPLLTSLKEENSNMPGWNWFAWIASTLSEIGEAALQPLIATLKDQDDFARYWAANALGNIGNKQAVDALNTALEDDEPLVRLSVAAALTKLGDDKAIELLITALKNEDENIRYFAVLNLCGIGDSRATEALNTVLEDSDDFMRSEAVLAVGKVGASRDALLRGVLLDEAKKWILEHPRNLGAAEREFLREGSTFEGTMEETRLEEARTVQYAIGKLQGCLLRFLVVLELPLIARFVLQFLGADSSNIFTAVLYAITGVILFPFHGILQTSNLDGHQAEWSTLVGIVVYWLLFLLIVNFLHMLVSSPEEHEPWYRRITK